MIPVAISLHRRSSIFWYVSILVGALICCAVSPAAAQPALIDGRSALILSFDPAAPATDPYLERIADALSSEWIAATGAEALAIGPLFAQSAESGSGVDYSAIDPMLGTNDDWQQVLEGSRRAKIALAVRLSPPDTSTLDELVGWATETGIRHFIIGGAGSADIPTLRAALDSGAAEPSWIAGTSALDGVDAVIEIISAGDLGNDQSVGAVYRAFSERNATSAPPLIAALASPLETDDVASRVLMLPGALQVAAVPSDAPQLWQRIAGFRSRHPAVSRGEHQDLVNNSIVFGRTLSDRGMDDRVIVVMGASGPTTINVSRIFPDNALLQDALTGRTAFVSFGMATFDPDSSGVILIEEVY